MKQQTIEVYINVLFCVVIMPLTVMLTPIDRWLEGNTCFFFSLIVYLYTLFFTYKWAKIPSLFLHHHYLRITLWITLVMTATLLFTHIPFERYASDAGDYLINREELRSRTIWFFFLVVTGFSMTLELTIELFKQILMKKELEVEKKHAQLAVYKAQINPHFLFNTLNSLYSLIISRSDKLESAFIKFSGILKYMYSQAESHHIPINEEIEYIRQYVDLQKLRLNKHTQVIMQTEIDNENIQIPPMLLITFVENAFKYGTSSEKDCTIHISLKVKQGELSFETTNHVMKQKQDNSSNIGIENCRRRLDMLYHNRYTLQTKLEGDVFTALLNIPLI